MSEDWEQTRRLLEELTDEEAAEKAVRELSSIDSEELNEYWEKLSEKTLVEHCESTRRNRDNVDHVLSLAESFSPEKQEQKVGENFRQFYDRLINEETRENLRNPDQAIFLDENCFDLILGNAYYEFEVEVPLDTVQGVALAGYLESSFSGYEMTDDNLAEGTSTWTVEFGRDELLQVLQKAKEEGVKVYYADELPEREKETRRLQQRLNQRGYPEEMVESVVQKVAGMENVEPVEADKDYRSEHVEDGGLAKKARELGADIITLDTDYLGSDYDIINKKPVGVYTPHQMVELRGWEDGT